jgi:hypothetical protein
VGRALACSGLQPASGIEALDQPDGIVNDVVLYPPKLLRTLYKPIIALVLPKRLSLTMELLIRFPSCPALESSHKTETSLDGVINR